MNRVVEGARDRAKPAEPVSEPVYEVVVSRTIDAARADVEAVLSSASIVEYAGTYRVAAVEDGPSGIEVTARADDLEIVLEFTATGGPYIYQQRRGPFEAMYASLTFGGDDPTTVTARSCFTFGLPIPRLTDWIASRERRTEL